MTGSTLPDRRADAPPDAEAGTSLVEVMVATLLLAVGVLAVLASVGAAERATEAGERRSAAVRVATGELEVLRSIPYDDVGIATTAAGYVTRFEGRSTVTGAVNRVAATDTITDGRTTFEIRRHVTWSPIVVDGTRVAQGYKQATVIVSWTDPAGNHQLRQDTGLYAVGVAP